MSAGMTLTTRNPLFSLAAAEAAASSERLAFAIASRCALAAAKSSPLVIGSVCALRPEKRMDLLLEAFSRVRGLNSRSMLLIVGSGPMLPALEEQRRCLGLDGACVFQSAQSNVADWMRAMDIFVMPSSSESFPNALLEAMACGRCVIGSRVGGIPELISDGRTGLLFEPNNIEALARALESAIRQKRLRENLGNAAACSAREDFSIEIAVERHQDLYMSLLNRSAPMSF